LPKTLQGRMFSGKVPPEGTSMNKNLFKSVCVAATLLAVFAVASYSQDKKANDSAHKIVRSLPPAEFPAARTVSAFPLCEIRPSRKARWYRRRNIQRTAENTQSPRDRSRPTPLESLCGCSAMLSSPGNPVESTVSLPWRGIRFSYLRFPFTL